MNLEVPKNLKRSSKKRTSIRDIDNSRTLLVDPYKKIASCSIVSSLGETPQWNDVLRITSWEK